MASQHPHRLKVGLISVAVVFVSVLLGQYVYYTWPKWDPWLGQEFQKFALKWGEEENRQGRVPVSGATAEVFILGVDVMDTNSRIHPIQGKIRWSRTITLTDGSLTRISYYETRFYPVSGGGWSVIDQRQLPEPPR